MDASGDSASGQYRATLPISSNNAIPPSSAAVHNPLATASNRVMSAGTGNTTSSCALQSVEPCVV